MSPLTDFVVYSIAGICGVVALGLIALLLRIWYVDWSARRPCSHRIVVPCEFGSTYEKSLPCELKRKHLGIHKATDLGPEPPEPEPEPVPDRRAAIAHARAQACNP